MSAQHQPSIPPSPMQIFNTVMSVQRAYALKAAVDLELFTTIARGSGTAGEIAKSCHAAERGVRILCDAMTVLGFLAKSGSRYSLTQDSAVFLDKNSPAYMGNAFSFFLHPLQIGNCQGLTESARRGGALPEDSALAPEDTLWLEFARGMSPMMVPAAEAIAGLLQTELASRPAVKVLDIAASHGIFGLTVAKRLPQAHIYALDWANVLEIAKENAQAQGVAERYHLLPGSAFDVDYGTGFDAVLITNLLHHFEPAENEKLLKKAHAALKPGGQVILLEFVPNEDRISPPVAALFSLTMLSSTPRGDAYTLAQYTTMCRNAGFEEPKLVPLDPTPEALVVARKAF
ncbi:MAG: class I SAM-dependent methyltransferase [Candidatus Angelobacter sp.]